MDSEIERAQVNAVLQERTSELASVTTRHAQALESIKSGIYIVKVLSDNGQSIFKKLIIN